MITKIAKDILNVSPRKINAKSAAKMARKEQAAAEVASRAPKPKMMDKLHAAINGKVATPKAPTIAEVAKLIDEVPTAPVLEHAVGSNLLRYGKKFGKVGLGLGAAVGAGSAGAALYDKYKHR